MGSTTRLDSGDDRMQQTQFIGGEIWGELGTIVSIAGDPKPRAGAAWFRVAPSLSGSVLGSANVDAQGYLGMAFNNITYPAIQANSSGAAAIIYIAIGSRHSLGSRPAAAAMVAPGGESAAGAADGLDHETRLG